MQLTLSEEEKRAPLDLEEKYINAFETACDSMQIALDIIHSEGYEDRSTWKQDCKNDHVAVHYKDIGGIRYFAARTKVPVAPHEGHDLNWHHADKMSEWNSNIKFSDIVTRLTEDVDVTRYASNDLAVVKSREYVCARMKKTVGPNHIISAKSCTLETFPESKNAVRAILHLGVGRYIEDPSDSSKSIYDYLVSMDLKGMMFTSMMNQIMGKLVLSDVENTRKHMIKVGEKSAST